MNTILNELDCTAFTMTRAVCVFLPRHSGDAVSCDFVPDVIHANDWQTALVPVYLNLYYRHLEQYRSIKTVFTIHNIQYQANTAWRSWRIRWPLDGRTRI
mgnify:CR=1 FL=1